MIMTIPNIVVTLLLLLLTSASIIIHGYSSQRITSRKLPNTSSSSLSTTPFVTTNTNAKNSCSIPEPSVLPHHTSDHIQRRTFLSILTSTTTTSCLLPLIIFSSTSSSSTPAFAKEVDPALKGTKADPAFQACLGRCMYECTKPKGSEQRSRAECLPECKTKCATSKEQLMTGTPLKKVE